MGATKIIGIDINEKKKEKGEAFGMTDFINPNDHYYKSYSQLVKDLTNGLGVDYALECTGVAPLLAQALESTKMVNIQIANYLNSFNKSSNGILYYYISIIY